MNKISMLINGKPAQASTGATFARANPLDGTSATIAPAASVDDAVAAVAAAAAFREWSLKGPGERRKICHISTVRLFTTRRKSHLAA